MYVKYILVLLIKTEHSKNVLYLQQLLDWTNVATVVLATVALA